MVDAVDSKFTILRYIGSSPITANGGSLMVECCFVTMEIWVRFHPPPFFLKINPLGLKGIVLVFDIKVCRFESTREILG